MDDGISLLSAIIVLGGLAYFLKTINFSRAGRDPAIATYINEPIDRQKRARQSLYGQNPEADQNANILAELEEIRQLALLDKTQLQIPEETWRMPEYVWRQDVTPNYNNQ